jgi:PAS domain-containing protein
MLIEALPAAILVVDRDGVTCLLNVGAEDLLQVGRKNLLGRRCPRSIRTIARCSA